MRRALFVLLVIVTLGLALVPSIPRVKHWRCRRHNPVRHPLSGFRCSECGMAGADLDEMGYPGGGYVSPLRSRFDRKHGERTRESWTH